MPRRLRLGLRAQLLVGLSALAFVAVLSAGLLSLLVAKQSYTSYEEESARALCRAAAGLLEAAREPGRTFADDLRQGRLGLTARGLAGSRSFSTLAIADRDGALRFTAGAAAEGGAPPGGGTGMAGALDGLERIERLERLPGDPAGAGTELQAFLPLRGPTGLEGALHLGIAIDATMGAAEARSRRLLLGLGLLDGGVILLVGALLLGQLIVRPVTELERAADRIARGERIARVSEDGPGEVGSLAASFNRMTAALGDKVAELEARSRELAASREQLVRAEKLASVGRLAAGLAHEVGNPLSAMLGYVELLLRPGATPDPALARDLLERLQQEIERIHRIMQDLLAYSRPAPERVMALDLGETVRAALALVRPQRRFHDLDLACELADDLPLVSASPGRLTQVLVNLLLNAADAAGERGRIVVRAAPAGAAVLLEVSDSGTGVPAADRERIFDPFFTTKEPGQGTGLGLSISLSLCESFGATLQLRDAAPGTGATFQVQLRVADEAASEAREPAALKPAAGNGPARPGSG